MAYNNYLLKVGGTILPTSFIKFDSYEVVPNQVLDNNSYRDSKGLLHRTIVENTPSKISFQTKPMTEAQLQAFRSFLSNKKKVSVEFFCPDTGNYKTEYMYIPDITFKIYSVAGGVIKYQPATVSFIGY